MDKISKTALKDGRARLAKVIRSNGFTGEITPQTVSKLTRKGFQIGGTMGAEFDSEHGLCVWNRGQRYAGGTFSVGRLVKLENELKKEFENVWDMIDNMS